MSEPKHTPGRWYVGKNVSNAFTIESDADPHWNIAVVTRRGSPEWRANALLLAAAPDLLAALIDIVDHGPEIGALRSQAACAAIAKATGEAS